MRDEYSVVEQGSREALPTLTVAQSMALAWRHQRAGNRDDAVMISMRVLLVEPKNADALHLLGVVAYQTNDHDRAIELIGEAIRAHKKYAPMHGNLALAKLAKGDVAGAVASARRAFSLNPSYADAHRVLGLVYHRKGRLREAVEEYQRALALGLNTPDLQTHLAKAIDEYHTAEPRPVKSSD